MDPVDIEIQNRLNKLKEDKPPIPSEDEVYLRLQKLKGDKPKPSTALPNRYVLLPCTKSSEDQVNDLMKQYSDEASLEQRFRTPVNDIEERLNNLKMHRFSNSNSDRQKLTETERSSRSKKESISREFDSKVEAMTTDEDESVGCSTSYPQEYFCYICDRVPKWICYTCDDQLFCAACFKEFHEDEDEPHKRRPFNAKHLNADSD